MLFVDTNPGPVLPVLTDIFELGVLPTLSVQVATVKPRFVALSTAITDILHPPALLYRQTALVPDCYSQIDYVSDAGLPTDACNHNLIIVTQSFQPALSQVSVDFSIRFGCHL